MHRFFITEEIKDNVAIVSDDAQFHHLKNVLRLKRGDEVIVCDREGNEFVCAIAQIEKTEAKLEVIKRKPVEAGRLSLTVACAIPKQARLDDIIDGLTQLGVDSIIPMVTERVIVRLDESRGEARLNRWRRIAQSAAQQSQRSAVPEVRPVAHFEDVLARARDFDLKLLPTLLGDRPQIKDVLAGENGRNILVLIGPEGDFTPDEVELAKQSGFIPVSLGDSILRVSTAAMAIASYIKLWSGG